MFLFRIGSIYLHRETVLRPEFAMFPQQPRTKKTPWGLLFFVALPEGHCRSATREQCRTTVTNVAPE